MKSIISTSEGKNITVSENATDTSLYICVQNICDTCTNNNIAK